MIRVTRRDPPEGFDENVAKPGEEWLNSEVNRKKRYPRKLWNTWSPCRDAVKAMFAERCGYAALFISSGQVEHFVSWKRCQSSNQHQLAYTWSNYRWILPQLNGRKGTKNVLDPFEVQDEWFELDPFTMNLRLTDAVPGDQRDLAELTVHKTLRLANDPLIVELRQEAVKQFEEGAPLAALEHRYPQVYRALSRLFDAPAESLTPEHLARREDLLGKHKEACARDPHR